MKVMTIIKLDVVGITAAQACRNDGLLLFLGSRFERDGHGSPYTYQDFISRLLAVALCPDPNRVGDGVSIASCPLFRRLIYQKSVDCILRIKGSNHDLLFITSIECKYGRGG